MRVVHIIKIVLTAGAERHLLRLLPGLQAHGVDVRLIVLVQPNKPMNDFMALADEAGISAERMTIHSHADVSLVPRLARRLCQLQPDIVHTHLLHADLYGSIATQFAGVRTVIISRHNDNAFRYKLPSRIVNNLLWRLSSGGIAISHALRQFCINIEGAAPDKITTVHYGLDMQGFAAPRAGEPGWEQSVVTIGTASRLIEQKGLRYAIQAFAQLAPDYPNVQLLIAGDGVLRAELEAQVASLNLNDRVRFLGWQQDITRVMAGYDVFLMPSLWEGFGLALLEAMALSRPVVATHVSAIPEIVQDGETGILVPPRDADALAVELRRLLDDPERRKRMGAAGRARVAEHFSEEKMISETLAVYWRSTGKSV